MLYKVYEKREPYRGIRNENEIAFYEIRAIFKCMQFIVLLYLAFVWNCFACEDFSLIAHHLYVYEYIRFPLRAGK